ncbi:MAG: hypothetical protein LH632_13500 [Rhodoferax sp.]|nr:hypothetical protein [Rhodoferax sp.]
MHLYPANRPRQRSELIPGGVWLLAGLLVCATAVRDAGAQQNKAVPVLPTVTVTAKANRDPVEKSYRKIIRGMDLFEAQHNLAPAASLRFKLLARQRDTDMHQIEINVIGNSVDFLVPLAPDNTFSMERNKVAFDEDAQVVPDRKARSMTWRTDIRTPGLPPHTRRLGDLRLECRVGMEAGLISESVSLVGRIAGALVGTFVNTPAYCDKLDAQYLFFADRPLFGVTLVAGTRREALPINRLYGGASEERDDEDRSGCDCELLVDRTYFMPLGDRSWPDDTLVEFELMDDRQ